MISVESGVPKICHLILLWLPYDYGVRIWVQEALGSFGNIVRYSKMIKRLCNVGQVAGEANYLVIWDNWLVGRIFTNLTMSSIWHSLSSDKASSEWREESQGFEHFWADRPWAVLVNKRTGWCPQHKIERSDRTGEIL